MSVTKSTGLTAMHVAYLARLPGRVDALRLAARGLATSQLEAAGAARRVAHMLRGSAGSFGYGELGRRAEGVELASDLDLPGELAGLIGVIDELLVEAGTMFRVLLVEDDEPLASLLAERLSNVTRAVTVARTAGEAKASLAQEVPSIILLDLLLPDADGRDILMAIRGEVGLLNVPVLILSVRAGEALHKECLALGANAYIEKPIELGHLEERVTEELQRAALRQVSSRDALTGLAGRDMLAIAYERCLARTRRGAAPAALALLDLDRLKEINDIQGHAAGDRALIRLADRLASSLRKTDLAARWGGDEFAVLFEETSVEDAAAVLRKLQNELRVPEDGTPAILYSAGVVSAMEEPLGGAMAAADLLLYRAKRCGGGAVLTAEAPVPALNRKSALVVEDDPAATALVIAELAAWGFETEPARDGRSAMEALGRASFDLVILDVGLPDIDGFSVLKRLRAMRRHASVPVIMLTASRSASDIERSFELGADDYLSKPFSPRELLARTRRLVQRNTRRKEPGDA